MIFCTCIVLYIEPYNITGNVHFKDNIPVICASQREVCCGEALRGEGHR